MYKAIGVPVGVDQLPHVELTREIARRFNFLYGEIFPIPDPLLTEVPKLLGIDGRKMSKSYDNAIYISDRGDVLAKKVGCMFTDPQRIRRTDPGRPEICNVFTFHKLYASDEKIQEIDRDCRGAAIGCTDCKRRLYEELEQALREVHERQDFYRAHPEDVRAVIEDGTARAIAIARDTMKEVREAVRI